MVRCCAKGRTNDIKYLCKIVAVAYVVWGLLHLKAAQMMVVLGQSFEAEWCRVHLARTFG